jgi:uncharacterized protein (TIGR01777 family)
VDAHAANATALDENAPAGGDFAATLCQQWEAEALTAEALGVRTCVLRTGIVLDRDGGALVRMLPPFRLGLGGPMGDGSQWMSWIHRDDRVGMILWLLAEQTARGAYNGTAPAALSNAAFARTLATVLGWPALLTTPAFALKLAFGEMAGLLLTGQNVVPARALQGGCTFQYPTLEPALRAITSPQQLVRTRRLRVLEFGTDRTACKPPQQLGPHRRGFGLVGIEPQQRIEALAIMQSAAE